MLILILSDVQYSQNAILSFEKDSNHQNLPRFSPPGKKFPTAVFTTFWHKVRETLQVFAEKEQ